jgi:hypothetical protein
MPPKIDVEQRRARLGVRHHLAVAATTAREAIAGVVALHATDPATVHLSVAARLGRPAVPDVERVLYQERTCLRLLGMRRTVFVTDLETAALVQHGCSADVAARHRRLLEKELGQQGHPENVPEPATWLAEVETAVEAALHSLGSATATQLAGVEPRLRQRLQMYRGKPYEAISNVTSRVLFQLAADGRIVRGRPRGTWLSTQYVWHPLREWIPDGLKSWEPDTSRTELARLWLRAYGPAPVSDLRWWMGWTIGQTRRALAGVATVEVELDGVTGLVVADDLEPVDPPEPWAALLPSLDPTSMGWQDRRWFLGEHQAALFDRAGNIGPTVWVNGRIVGGWAQRATGEVVHRLLENVSSEEHELVDEAAGHCATWLGGTRVIPRMRTPLERELAT